MEETPEEVMARLQRYVDSLNARAQVAPTNATLSAPPVLHSFSTLTRTVAGQVICVATCVVTILLWVNLTHALAYIVVPAVAITLAPQCRAIWMAASPTPPAAPWISTVWPRPRWARWTRL